MSRFFSIIFILGLGASQANSDPILPIDSGSEIEIRIAGMLKERLKIDAKLEHIGDSGENTRVYTLIRENQEMGTPRLATYVDTRVLGKKSQQVVTQVITIYSTADIGLVTGDRLKLLEWVNNWNKSYVPVKVQVTDGRVLASSTLVVTALLPVEEERVLFTYLSVTQAWPAIIKSLRGQGLISE